MCVNGQCIHPGRDSTIKDRIVPTINWVTFKNWYPKFDDYCSDDVIILFDGWLSGTITVAGDISLPNEYDKGYVSNNDWIGSIDNISVHEYTYGGTTTCQL